MIALRKRSRTSTCAAAQGITPHALWAAPALLSGLRAASHGRVCVWLGAETPARNAPERTVKVVSTPATTVEPSTPSPRAEHCAAAGSAGETAMVASSPVSVFCEL